jgi:prepilin-type N-terminal cleavage/methylation domain-containing protein
LTLSSKANSNGFTFIEVMIVIMIIGILAAIALPNFLAHREKGKISHASLELKSIEIAIKALAIDTGLWPNKRAAEMPPVMKYGILMPQVPDWLQRMADTRVGTGHILPTFHEIPGVTGTFLITIIS